MTYNRIFLILGIPALVLLSLPTACTKWDDYKKHLKNGELVYPSKVTDIQVLPGDGRVLLTWVKQIDESVTSFKIFWNNGTDSSEVDATQYQIGDTVKHYISGLRETSYTFTVYAYDAMNNKSVASEAPPISVYGDRYRSAILNRPVKSFDYSPENSTVTIVWGVPDSINLTTKITYTDQYDTERTLDLKADEDTSTISWRKGTKIFFRSAYLPVANAIDHVEAIERDSITIENVPLSKSAWKIVNLPHDVSGDAHGTSLSFLWDGEAGGYPNIYHTDDGLLPHHFTIDLGNAYELTMLESVGRQDCACHNPTEFEVWGIYELSGAATALPSDDPGWKDESEAKGWFRLTTVARTDDGISPLKVNLNPNTPPIRYIRFRILKTNDNSPESHMSEVSFWYNP